MGETNSGFSEQNVPVYLNAPKLFGEPLVLIIITVRKIIEITDCMTLLLNMLLYVFKSKEWNKFRFSELFSRYLDSLDSFSKDKSSFIII